MNAQKEQNNGVFRNSSLIAGKTKRMALTYIESTICVATVTAVDSLVAGINIGSAALAAIAAAGPLLAIKQILHCILGFGIDKMMIQAVGKGKRKEADRIFGAVLLTVAAVYLLVYLALILLERPLLELLMEDQTLIDLMILYTRPLFAAAPIFEVLLCIERAFRVDGRARLFAARGIITNIANIVLDLLLVSVLGLSLSGLAWSSVISTALGYIVTISHFFSPKRTVTPDFSVLFSGKELLSLIKEDMRLGSSATLDEVMDGLALAAQTSVIGIVGGSGGLAIWAVYKTLRGIVLSMGNGISASVSTHAGLLNGQKDYDGVRYSVKKGVGIGMASSLMAFVLVYLFAGGLADLYRIEPELRTLCTQCLRVGSIAFPAMAFLTVLSAYLPAVNRVGLCNLLVLIQKGLTAASAAIASITDLKMVFVLYGAALWLAAAVLLVLLARDRFWFVPERNPELIMAYSLRLEPEPISDMSTDAARQLSSCAYPAGFCFKAALVLEESVNYIARQNPGEEILADIQLRRREDGVQILIIDDGEAYNPLVSMAEIDWDKPDALEEVVVQRLSARVNYDRVLDLNHLSLDVNLPEQAAV